MGISIRCCADAEVDEVRADAFDIEPRLSYKAAAGAAETVQLDFRQTVVLDQRFEGAG